MQIFKNLVMLLIILSCACFLSINSQFVGIRLLPDIFKVNNAVVHVPLFVVMLICGGGGLILGTLFEYLRGYKDRRVAQNNLIQAKRLNTKSKMLSNSVISETDEIISLLK